MLKDLSTVHLVTVMNDKPSCAKTIREIRCREIKLARCNKPTCVTRYQQTERGVY
jgi:hypothetical protein